MDLNTGCVSRDRNSNQLLELTIHSSTLANAFACCSRPWTTQVQCLQEACMAFNSVHCLHIFHHFLNKKTIDLSSFSVKKQPVQT